MRRNILVIAVGLALGSPLLAQVAPQPEASAQGSVPVTMGTGPMSSMKNW